MPFSSGTAAPWGLRPVRRLNGDSNIQLNWYYSSANVIIGKGDPVASDGTHATGETTVTRFTAGSPIRGVAWAFSPTNPNGPITLAAPAADSYTYKPAAASLWIGVIDDPTVVFSIQEDGDTTPVALASIGLNADLATAADANTTTGLSVAALDSNTVNTTATLNLKILGFSKMADGSNVASDSYNAFDVLINSHELAQGTGSTGI